MFHFPSLDVDVLLMSFFVFLSYAETEAPGIGSPRFVITTVSVPSENLILLEFAITGTPFSFSDSETLREYI